MHVHVDKKGVKNHKRENILSYQQTKKPERPICGNICPWYTTDVNRGKYTDHLKGFQTPVSGRIRIWRRTIDLNLDKDLSFDLS